MTSLRGLDKRLAKRARFERLVLDNNFDDSPVYSSVHLRGCTSAPTDVVEGDIYYNSTTNTLELYDGTAFRTLGSVDINQDFAGTLDVTGAVVFDSTLGVTGATTLSSTLAVTGATTLTGQLAAPRKVYTAPTTLVAADSGALCTFDTAAGMLYTLPAAVAGLHFDFVVQTTCTSGVHRVACASADFFLGTILQIIDTTFAPTARTADGTTHLAWEGNGTTTGGIIGDFFRVTAIDAVNWQIWGINTATGAEATPFKVS